MHLLAAEQLTNVRVPGDDTLIGNLRCRLDSAFSLTGICRVFAGVRNCCIAFPGDQVVIKF